MRVIFLGKMFISASSENRQLRWNCTQCTSSTLIKSVVIVHEIRCPSETNLLSQENENNLAWRGR